MTSVGGAIEPITIKLPDGMRVYSTNVKSLNTYTVVAIIFDEWECIVYYKGELVLSEEIDEKADMWKLPIKPVSSDNTLLSLDLPLQEPIRQQHSTKNLYTRIPYHANSSN